MCIRDRDGKVKALLRERGSLYAREFMHAYKMAAAAAELAALAATQQA